LTALLVPAFGFAFIGWAILRLSFAGSAKSRRMLTKTASTALLALDTRRKDLGHLADIGDGQGDNKQTRINRARHAPLPPYSNELLKHLRAITEHANTDWLAAQHHADPQPIGAEHHSS
jgi:hypothetical protein